jgi:hypothetical protein
MPRRARSAKNRCVSEALRSYDAFVAMWACPHCGAPQTETARCWVCRRSSTTCSTCRHFRASLAADVGFCAKDRWRTPLTGLELRACWEEGRRAAADPGPVTNVPMPDATPRRSWTTVRGDGGPLDRPDPMRLRGFVPIEEVQGPEVVAEGPPIPKRSPRPRRGKVAAPVVRRADRPVPVDDWEARVSLFGEADL